MLPKKFTAVFSLFLVKFSLSQLISDLSELPLDPNGNLASNWFLATKGCSKIGNLNLREKGELDKSVAISFFGASDVDDCVAVCLEIGTPKSYIQHLIPEHIYLGSKVGDKDLKEWVEEQCQKVEVGFISYNENPAIVNWISPTTHQRFKLSDLLKSEYHTFWTTTYLGHEFEIVDAVTNEVLGVYTAKHDAFYPIGDAGTYVGTNIGDEVNGVTNVFRSEYGRSRRIKRTFTELGFAKGRLPDDVWSSIQTYYYNNRNNYVREEYENKGLTVNWYEVDPKFLGMPWGRKGYWQNRLQTVVQRWIGNLVDLENTDIYGMRRYEDGARLLTHVDREATHAVSLIVNVAQGGVRSPWTVEIYDHANRLHQIEMNPGDIVYYESARCLHGRMTPLDGGYYVNLFTHYRPRGDPQWFTKPNPPGTPEPLMNIEGLEIPTLSSWNHTVKSGHDLLNFWKMVRPSDTVKNSRTEL